MMNRKIIFLVTLGLLMMTGCSENGFPVEKQEWPTLTAIPTIQGAIREIALPTEVISTEEYAQTEAVFIPAGRFVMGAAPESGYAVCEESRPGCELTDFVDEGPVREVYLDEFWIDKFEVTNADYHRCVEDGSCAPPALLEFYNHPDFETHPVVYVNWFQAESYCQWVGGYLPTEAQWEKAGRGQDERLFPWGNDLSCGKANLKGCTMGLTMAAGSFPDGASPFGAMDMAGNAAEWVVDWYDPAGYNPGELVNPTGPVEGELKVARGGSWKNPFAGVRTTNRSANYPEVFSSGVGFRCGYDQKP
jgi:formylglycine-generating enzyme required for sulfatase activity